jgi:hypothetical protein
MIGCGTIITNARLTNANMNFRVRKWHLLKRGLGLVVVTYPIHIVPDYPSRIVKNDD